MEYVINISRLDERDGRYYHHFRVILDTAYKAKVVYNELKIKYPRPTYKVDVYEWQKRGVQIDCWDDETEVN